jgi:hypothetical protein
MRLREGPARDAITIAPRLQRRPNPPRLFHYPLAREGRLAGIKRRGEFGRVSDARRVPAASAGRSFTGASRFGGYLLLRKARRADGAETRGAFVWIAR